MTASPARLAWPVAAFVAFALAVYLAAVFVVVPSLASVAHPDVLAGALAVDLAVLVPLAYAGMVRARGGPWATLLPVVIVSVGAAWWVLPPGHRGVWAPIAVALPVLEAGALVLVVVALVRSLRRPLQGDALDRIRAVTASALGDGWAARALAYELAVLRYALGPSVAVPDGSFSYRRSSGYGAVLAGVIVAAGLELVGGHVLVRHVWGDGAALAHLAVSGYAIVWVVGDWRALRARPVTLGSGVLRVRCGTRWSVEVPVADVETVYHVRRALPGDRPTLDASVLKNAQLAIDLARPVEAEGPYGLRRRVERVAVRVDEPDRFLASIAAALRG